MAVVQVRGMRVAAEACMVHGEVVVKTHQGRGAICTNDRGARINAVISPHISRLQVRVESMQCRLESEVILVLRQELLPALVISARSFARSQVGALGGRWIQFERPGDVWNRKRLNEWGCRRA